MKKSHTGNTDSFTPIYREHSVKQRKPFLNHLRIVFLSSVYDNILEINTGLLFAVIPLIIRMITSVLVINNTTDVTP